jgi:hypothetical protein
MAPATVASPSTSSEPHDTVADALSEAASTAPAKVARCALTTSPVISLTEDSRIASTAPVESTDPAVTAPRHEREPACTSPVTVAESALASPLARTDPHETSPDTEASGAVSLPALRVRPPSPPTNTLPLTRTFAASSAPPATRRETADRCSISASPVTYRLSVSAVVRPRAAPDSTWTLVSGWEAKSMAPAAVKPERRPMLRVPLAKLSPALQRG